MKWFDKRFHSLNYHYRNRFGCKIIKIPIDAGFSCPNRDGSAGYGGCIFCSNGSADISADKTLPISAQIVNVRKNLNAKWPEAKYIPYFQANTNTYAPADVLRQKYAEALSTADVVGISIATRPDCLDADVMNVLSWLSENTAVYVELGLQTAHMRTAELINRCYDNRVFEEAVIKLKALGIHTVAHIILGLPDENKADMLETVDYAAACGIDGIKLQLLHVLRDTPLADMYLTHRFETLTFDEYVSIVVSCLEMLPENIVIHRLTGDGLRDDLIAPWFLLDKRRVLNAIDRELRERDTCQSARRKDPYDRSSDDGSLS